MFILTLNDHNFLLIGPLLYFSLEKALAISNGFQGNCPVPFLPKFKMAAKNQKIKKKIQRH